MNGRNWTRLTIGLLSVLTVIRLLQLSAVELVPDEAYYWDWSRHLALGYYDQGPMIAYVIRLTTMVFGTNEFGVRFGALAASLGAIVCSVLLARRLFSPRAGFLVALLLGLTPLMEIGSIVATYDPIQVFFWALAVLLLERAVFTEAPNEQIRAWLAAGMATGLGFLSKHTMLFIVPCLLLFLVLSPRRRFWLRRPEPYTAFALALLLYTGVLWWNVHHHWWTFRHLLFLTAKSSSPIPARLGGFVGSQALLLGPGLFLGTLAAGWRSLHNAITDRRTIPGSGQERELFLVCLGLPLFLFFCLLTFKAKVQGNWAPCAWLTPTVLWAGWLSSRAERGPAAARSIAARVGATVAFSVFLTLAMIWPALRQTLGVRLPPDADLSNTAYGWRATMAHVNTIRKEMEHDHKTVFLISNGYQYCALMAFYLPDHPETQDMFLHFRLTMYAAYVDRLKQRFGEDAIFINDTGVEDGDLRRLFETVVWDPVYPVWRRPMFSHPIRRVHIARCHNFQHFVGLGWARGG